MSETAQPKWTYRQIASYRPAFWLYEDGDEQERCRVDSEALASQMCDDLNAAEEQRHASEPGSASPDRDTHEDPDNCAACGKPASYRDPGGAYTRTRTYHPACLPGSASEPRKWSVREIDPGAHTFVVRQLIYEERLIVIEADRPVHESYKLIPQMCNDLNAAEEKRHVTGTFRDARGAVPQRRATDEKPEAVIRRMRNGAPRDDDGRQQTAFAEAYLPMDCPACGRARLQVFYDPAGSPPFTVECEKCGSTKFDCDEEAHRQGGPHPQTGSAAEVPDVPR